MVEGAEEERDGGVDTSNIYANGSREGPLWTAVVSPTMLAGWIDTRAEASRSTGLVLIKELLNANELGSTLRRMRLYVKEGNSENGGYGGWDVRTGGHGVLHRDLAFPVAPYAAEESGREKRKRGGGSGGREGEREGRSYQHKRQLYVPVPVLQTRRIRAPE